MKKIVLATAIAALFAVSPAFAAGKLKCTSSAMKSVDTMMHDMMGDKKMKKMVDMAMNESEMAGKAKKAGDKKGCAMHLNMAQEDLMAHQ